MSIILQEDPLQEEVNNKPLRKKRSERLETKELILTRPLDFRNSIKMRLACLLRTFQETIDPSTTEHLPGEESVYFQDVLDTNTLPIGGIIEVWRGNGHSGDYQVTKYKKLR